LREASQQESYVDITRYYQCFAACCEGETFEMPRTENETFEKIQRKVENNEVLLRRRAILKGLIAFYNVAIYFNQQSKRLAPFVQK
jgi:hypothetical protein